MIPPTISIIIPSYNDGGKLIHLLNSIENQSFHDYEVIIIDGGSIDKTKELVSQNESLINYYISEKDDGIFDAMNKGIKVAQGEWLFFIGCDDLLCDPYVLEILFKGKSYNNIDVLYGKIHNVTKNKTVGEEIKSKTELLQSQFWHQGIFYNKLVFQKAGFYNTSYKIAADTVFNLEVFCKYNFNWKFIDKTITIFSGEGVSSVAFDKEYHKIQKELMLNLFSGMPKKMIYHTLQHHLYNEIKFGNLLKAFREYLILCWNTKKINPYTRNTGYWLKYRLFLNKQPR